MFQKCPNFSYFAIILQYYLYKKCLHFKFFPISVEGGVIENQIFPKFKIVHIILGGGGVQENYGLFPQFVTFPFWIAPIISHLTS